MSEVGALIKAVASRVDAWRGFPLGPASEPWAESGRYLPLREDERPVSETTALLLAHWFRPMPHEVAGPGGSQVLFRYWPHQRRFAETIIYLHEVLGVRSVGQLYDAVGVARDFEPLDPWPKLGGQLATGSGKTKMMSLLVAWSTLNALREGSNHLGLGPQTVVVAPGLFVKERLLMDFGPEQVGQHRPSVFVTDPVIPRSLARDWRLKVYGPEDMPLRLDPREAALVVTNVHQLMRSEEEDTSWSTTTMQEQLFFETGSPRKLEAEGTPLMSRFRKGPGVLVLNDEAHHVGDEPQHERFRRAAQNRQEVSGESEPEEMAWIRSLRALEQRAGLGLQVDLSATLYEEEGGARKAKGKKRSRPSPFRHTVIDYPLRDAIHDGVVKHPVLERVKVTDDDGNELESVRENQANAWLKYEPLLRAGIGRWQKVREQMRKMGDLRKPILFLLCADQGEAKEVANFLTYGVASREDLAGTRKVVGFTDPDRGEQLFVETDAMGQATSTVIQIHIGEKEDRNEEDWKRVREAINNVDSDDNPYNVVVSVMMLKEGWDVRNVKVIVPLRTCDSRTLTEQTLGRGLRRMHPPEMDENGAVKAVREELFVIEHPSFGAILDEISDVVELRSPDEPDAPPEYVKVERREDEETSAVDVRLVRFRGETEHVRDWVEDFVMPEVRPAERVPWVEEFSDRDVQTWIGALGDAADDEQGQRFQLSARPQFLDFERAIETAYVLPLLRELRVAFTHKNAVKGLVRELLEARTFRLPGGVRLSLDRGIGTDDGTTTLCNLLRPEVIAFAKDTLRGAIRDAMRGRTTERRAQLDTTRASQRESYTALKRHVAEGFERSVFRNGAFDSEDERRFAEVLEACRDVEAWVYNHRSGLGYQVEYDWQGHVAHYYPDFVVRTRWAGAVHNVIVEVKGRMDARDEAKVQVGQRHAALLSTHDEEAWHYLLVHEDPKVGRDDLSWLEALTSPELGALLKRQERLAPEADGQALKWRFLTSDAIGRHLKRLAGMNGGLSYDAMMELADEGVADRDRLLVVAESLATGARPGLVRSFVDRATGVTLNRNEVSRVMSLGGDEQRRRLEELDVVYRPIGAR